jgi:multimeric flavodoxin WrbA/putative sterol carrier protein
MKLLLLRSHPRKNGFSRQCTDLFVKGAREGGAEVIDVDLSSLDLKHCLGCYACWISSPGKCIISDAMETLLPLFLNAEIIVFSTPLNAYGVNSSLKIFLERTLPLALPGFVTTTSGLVRNRLRYPERWPKKMAAIVVGAFKGEENFSSVIKFFELYAHGMDLFYCGSLIRPESFLLQFTLAKPKTVKLIEAAFIKAGYELVTEGCISNKLAQQAAQPLAPDMAYFQHYSTIYWEHAVAMGKNASDLSALQNRVTTDVRILMYEMARSIDPAATARLKAVFQFDFPDKSLHFRLAVEKGASSLTEEKTVSPDLRVTCASDVWAKVFTRQINVRDAVRCRQILVEGDKSLFTRLDRYFPPPTL